MNQTGIVGRMLISLKETIFVKWLGRCPTCKGNRLHFVEGGRNLRKWFCTDCCTMAYVYDCPHCGEEVSQKQGYKPHIHQEYRLGKWADDDYFYKNSQKAYFKHQIKFHKDGLRQWRGYLKEWKRRGKSVLYAKG